MYQLEIDLLSINIFDIKGNEHPVVQLVLKSEINSTDTKCIIHEQSNFLKYITFRKYYDSYWCPLDKTIFTAHWTLCRVAWWPFTFRVNNVEHLVPAEIVRHTHIWFLRLCYHTLTMNVHTDVKTDTHSIHHDYSPHAPASAHPPLGAFPRSRRAAASCTPSQTSRAASPWASYSPKARLSRSRSTLCECLWPVNRLMSTVFDL